jgi:PAS domain S-box-containing protein
MTAHAEAEFAAALLEYVPDAVIACDADGRIVMLNRKAREGLVGWAADPEPGDIPSQRWAEHYRVYDRNRSRPARTEDLPLVRALRGETVRDVELELGHGTDVAVIVNISGGPVLDFDGEVRGAVIVMQDITERVVAEDRLRLQSAVLANTGAGVALVRADDGDIVYTNRQWERLFGYEQNELVGQHISVVNAPTDQTPDQRAQEILNALERTGVWTGEVHNARKDGSRFWTSCSVSRFKHPDHGIVWISINTDITRRKAAEGALHHSEERFRTAFEAGPVGIALVGDDGRVTDANRALCGIVGYARDELVGMPLSQLAHPDDVDLDAELAAKVVSGEIDSYEVEKRYLSKNGDVVPVALTAALGRAADGRRVSGITIVRRVERLRAAG